MRAVGVDWEDQPRRKVTRKVRSKSEPMGWPFAVFGAGGYWFRRPASSARWRSLRPPNVLLGETRQPCRILVAFTLPTFGRANSMSNTFAASRYAGGSSSSAPIDTLPALRSRFSCARSVRTSLALVSASMR